MSEGDRQFFTGSHCLVLFPGISTRHWLDTTIVSQTVTVYFESWATEQLLFFTSSWLAIVNEINRCLGKKNQILKKIKKGFQILSACDNIHVTSGSNWTKLQYGERRWADCPTPGWGAVGSWQLLEGVSQFSVSLVPGRSTMLQWMATHLRVHGQQYLKTLYVLCNCNLPYIL